MRIIQEHTLQGAEIDSDGVDEVATRAIDIGHINGFSFTAALSDVSGDADGTIHVEVSNNAFNGNVGNTSNVNPNAVWTVLPGSAYTVTPSSDSFMWDVSDAYYGACRVVCTLTDGTCTLDVWVHAKGPQS